MRNRWILVGYLTLFFAAVASRDLYIQNTVVVAVVAAILLIAGLLAWIASIRGSSSR